MGIMGYHDLCTYTLPCQQEAGTAADVNAWAGKLSGHSAAFLADWDALGLDGHLGWTASRALHWLYVDPRMDAHRRTMVPGATCRRRSCRLRFPVPALRALLPTSS